VDSCLTREDFVHFFSPDGRSCSNKLGGLKKKRLASRIKPKGPFRRLRHTVISEVPRHKNILLGDPQTVEARGNETSEEKKKKKRKEKRKKKMFRVPAEIKLRNHEKRKRAATDISKRTALEVSTIYKAATEGRKMQRTFERTRPGALTKNPRRTVSGVSGKIEEGIQRIP